MGTLPGFRVLSRSRSSTPASTNRRYQRQTAGRPTPASLAIWATVSRSAECKTIRARATMLLGAVAIRNELHHAIDGYLAEHNAAPTPFVWTKLLHTSSTRSAGQNKRWSQCTRSC
jgi:hypothetical protein